MKLAVEIIFILIFNGYHFIVCSEQSVEDEAKIFAVEMNQNIAEHSNTLAKAVWNYESNITDETKAEYLDVAKAEAKWTKEQHPKIMQFPWQTFQDENLKRQFRLMSILGNAALSEEKINRLQKLENDMSSIYGLAKICDFKKRSKCDLSLEPDLTRDLTNSNNAEELKYIWCEWRNSTGKKVRHVFPEYIKLVDEASRLNNFSNAADLWNRDFESSDFEQQIDELWYQVKPMYMQLHSYVRRKLSEKYGEEIVPKNGPIPAHLLGNMWAQDWSSLYDLIVPYPNEVSIDITSKLKEQNYTPFKMFKLAEEFFTSLNLTAMPQLFWNNSIVEKPSGVELICHASAWDFYDKKDFRIKMCTDVTSDDLSTVHHEMGHIQYYIQYKDQPQVYREGANSGFHEAVGDVMALSVSTPKHLKRIGLIDEASRTDESTINHLLNVALDKLAVLPFTYLMDKWRWGVFKGNVTEKDYNCNWWKLRVEEQGIEPPVDRTEEDFDPGAKYHIVASVPYIRYFVSHILQFQFHKALCEIAGEYDASDPLKPLSNCDIYQSTKAGNVLKKMLQLGSSKPWPEALEIVTGQRKMDATALLHYFKPLHTWLIEENRKHDELIGWNDSKRKFCKEDGN